MIYRSLNQSALTIIYKQIYNLQVSVKDILKNDLLSLKFKTCSRGDFLYIIIVVRLYKK